MKTQISLCLGLLFTIIGQDSSAQLGKVSVGLEIGVLNGGHLGEYPVFDGCVECGITVKIVEQSAMIGLAANIGGDVGITQRQSIGMGCLINELDFEQEKLTLDLSGVQKLTVNTYLLKYRSWHISHRIRLLNGNSIDVSWRNGLLHEKLLSIDKSSSSEHFRRRNWGFFTKLEFQLAMNKQNELILSPMSIFALTNYDDHEYLNTNFRPFRYGLMMGWRTYFSNAKRNQQ